MSTVKTLNSTKRIGIGVHVDLKMFLTETENLQNLKPEILMKNPQTVKYVRILLGLFQSEFEKATGIYRKRLSEYELGIHKPTYKMSKKILNENIIRDLRNIQDPETNFNENLELLTKLRLSGIGKSSVKEWENRGLKYGFAGSEAAPLSEQEKELYYELKNVPTEWHASISDPKKRLIPISVDLIIDKKILVSLRRVKTIDKKNLERHAAQLSLESFRLKKRIPNVKTYCLFETPKITKKVENLLNESFDFWTSSMEEFLNKIR
ncbi:MAG: helix-turn-helix transcriptional regulator [Candidatus Aenigmarchaeota archaeon]|nr:helix-turn-helix transcriptional regulator [Candidatus Aenigmarchaeota archaeon]